MTGSLGKTLAGGCQCGALRYEWVKPLTHSSVCYCRMCQKASGQPFMALAGGKAAYLRFTRGTLATFASSSFAERGFCRDCGTPLTYAMTGSGNISTTINSLDDPEAAPPTIQYGVESKVSWVDGVCALPAERTDQWMSAEQAAELVNRQHPDE